MKKLSDILQVHLRNLFFEDDVNEDLRNLQYTHHGAIRKYQTHNNSANVSDKDIEWMIIKCDEFITNKLLNKKILPQGKDTFGIKKLNRDNSQIIVILSPTYFDKETFEYDLKVITRNRYDDKNFIFKKEDSFDLLIDKTGYIKEIK